MRERKTDTGTQEEQAPFNPPVPSSSAFSTDNQKIFPAKLENELPTAYTAFQKWISAGGASHPESLSRKMGNAAGGKS
jgi:hypothetical protein